MFQKILVAVDGSDHANRALQAAVMMSRSLQAKELRLVFSYPPIPAGLGEPNLSNALGARLAKGREVMAHARAACEGLPCEVHEEILEGAPDAAILRVAEARQSDLIVLGTRGLNSISSLLLGSTSQKVAASAPCPVMIVR